jgi:hypothetical protein
MALSVSSIKQRLKDAYDAAYGAPADPAEQDKSLTAQANALFLILTTDASVSPGTFANGGGAVTGSGEIV